ncbi:hypothetical protein [Psychroserpens sp. MEBiC05023]
MKSKILYLILTLTLVSCANDRPLSEYDLSNIKEVIITNKGYNEIQNIANNAKIIDSIEINNLIDLLKKSEQLLDGIVSSNKGYIRLELQRTDEKNITLLNFYSNSNGQIIILEDDKGISRFRNDKFFEAVQNILEKNNRD